MKIIRPGVIPQPEQFTGACKHCGCVVECTQEETKPSPDPRDCGGWASVPCPTCMGFIWVRKKSVVQLNG